MLLPDISVRQLPRQLWIPALRRRLLLTEKTKSLRKSGFSMWETRGFKLLCKCQPTHLPVVTALCVLLLGQRCFMSMDGTKVCSDQHRAGLDPGLFHLSFSKYQQKYGKKILIITKAIHNWCSSQGVKQQNQCFTRNSSLEK